VFVVYQPVLGVPLVYFSLFLYIPGFPFPFLSACANLSFEFFFLRATYNIYTVCLAFGDRRVV